VVLELGTIWPMRKVRVAVAAVSSARRSSRIGDEVFDRARRDTFGVPAWQQLPPFGMLA